MLKFLRQTEELVLARKHGQITTTGILQRFISALILLDLTVIMAASRAPTTEKHFSKRQLRSSSLLV